MGFEKKEREKTLRYVWKRLNVESIFKKKKKRKRENEMFLLIVEDQQRERNANKN